MSPDFTSSPFLILISRMMPPSRCWTTRRLPSGLMVPEAAAALAMGMTDAQIPKPTTKTAMTPPP